MQSGGSARARVAFQGGRYESVNRLGAGKFGLCWAVTDNIEKKTKVIKQIHVGHMPADETIDALKEATLLKQLQHPFVIGYYDAFTVNEPHGQYVCIVMEFCEGGDLFEQVQATSFQGEVFKEQQLAQWFVELLQALSYIHSRKILHRDLKSKNIFLKHGSAKIGDFGIAKVLNSSQSEAQTLAGTPYYMSPECLKGSGYNAKSDIWALGVLMYELILLKVPFAATNLLELTMKICEADKPELPARYSSRFRASVEPLLVKDATMRPSADTTLACPYLLEHVHDATRLRTTSEMADISNSQIQSHSRSIQVALQSRSVRGPSPSGRQHSTMSTGSRERSNMSQRSRERSNVSQRSRERSNVSHRSGSSVPEERQIGRSHDARSPGRHVTDRDDAPVHVSFLSPRERMAATKRQAADDAAAAMRSHVVSNAMDGRSTERAANMQLNSTTEAAALIAGGTALPRQRKDEGGNRSRHLSSPGDGGGDGPDVIGHGADTATAGGQGGRWSQENRTPQLWVTNDGDVSGDGMSQTDGARADGAEPGSGFQGLRVSGYRNNRDGGHGHRDGDPGQRSDGHGDHGNSALPEGEMVGNSASNATSGDMDFRCGNIAKLRQQAQSGLGPLLYPKVYKYVRKARERNLDDAEITKKIGKLCKGDDTAVRAGFVADQLVLAELKHEARSAQSSKDGRRGGGGGGGGGAASNFCAIL